MPLDDALQIARNIKYGLLPKPTAPVPSVREAIKLSGTIWRRAIRHAQGLENRTAKISGGRAALAIGLLDAAQKTALGISGNGRIPLEH